MIGIWYIDTVSSLNPFGSMTMLIILLFLVNVLLTAYFPVPPSPFPPSRHA